MSPVPQVGEKAPDFELPEASESMVRLSEVAAKGAVVLAFYPTDWGMVCTMEMKRFLDMFKDLEAMGARILAVSVNSITSHRAWMEHMGIRWPLLSDPEGEVVKRYDLMIGENDLLSGRSNRAVFIIDRDMVVRYSWKAPDPSIQPDYEVLLEECRKVQCVRTG